MDERCTVRGEASQGLGLGGDAAGLLQLHAGRRVDAKGREGVDPVRGEMIEVGR